GITRRDGDVDAAELVGAAITGPGPANNWIIARCTAAGIHWRTCRVRATVHLITEDKSVGITSDGREAGAATRSHRGTIDAVCSILTQIILHIGWEPPRTDRSDDSSN